VTDSPTQPNVRIYLTIRQPPFAEDSPVYVRDCADGFTKLVCVDPRASRVDIALASAAIFTEAELNFISAAYGMTLVGQEIPESDDTLMSGDLCLLYVPPALRVPGESPLQGGTELDRRREAGLLDEELTLLAVEQSFQIITLPTREHLLRETRQRTGTTG
jgi:hypothetical protein